MYMLNRYVFPALYKVIYRTAYIRQRGVARHILLAQVSVVTEKQVERDDF